MSKSGIVNVRMVITEEKILFNIDKIQKLINPKSKKQIVQLDDDMYFKDLIESVKTYLIEYPKKKNFPIAVYKAAYGLVEYATNQFEENTKKIEELIRQREKNISDAYELTDALNLAEAKDEEWKDRIAQIQKIFSDDIVDTLKIVGTTNADENEEYEDAVKLLKARVNNLESNLHIEIDMERIDDRSKALSYIGIEVADALKAIPAPLEDIMFEEVQEAQVQAKPEPIQAVIEPIAESINQEIVIPQEIASIEAIVEQGQEELEQAKQQYAEETTFEAKPSLWQRFKNSKFIKTIRYITKIKVKLDYSALPEGRGE